MDAADHRRDHRHHRRRGAILGELQDLAQAIKALNI
jgi:hypothetical protein